ncbi:MAG: hypothetical protein SynsKO_23530 [Synoicihabitans sp.]
MSYEEEQEFEEDKKPSQVPSWLMVGFLIGVVTMWLFRSDPREPEEKPPAPVPTVPTVAELTAELERAAEPSDRASLVMVEAIFEEHRSWAFWNEDRTQIALWNSKTLSFSDHFEVIRTLEGDYFRSIPRFTRLAIPGYGPENSPILFTETAEQKAKRDRQTNPDAYPEPQRPDPVEFNTLPPAPGN